MADAVACFLMLLIVVPAHSPRIGVMRLLWCWRCRAEMPMLDEEEYGQVMTLWRQDGAMKERLALMLAEYVRITHYAGTNPNAVWHHRLSLYGPPCRSCGKPLRTPQAKLCGSCMQPVTKG